MVFEQQVPIAAPADSVYAFIADVPRMAQCLPGLEAVRETGDGTYAGALSVTVGPVSVRLEGKLRLAERDPAARTTKLVVEATDRRIRSSVSSTTRMEAVAAGDATELRVHTDAAILGKLGQLGQAVLRKKTDQLLAQFAANMAAALAEARP